MMLMMCLLSFVMGLELMLLLFGLNYAIVSLYLLCVKFWNMLCVLSHVEYGGAKLCGYVLLIMMIYVMYALCLVLALYLVPYGDHVDSPLTHFPNE
jgi:hypothetical protein